MRRFIYLLPLLILAGCSRQLENGLNEKDAQEVVVTLRQHGIDAETQLDAGDKKGSTWDVTVKGGSDKLVEAWNVLRQSGLPRRKESGLEDVYANAGMIPTASEEKARLLVGLSGELERTLRSVSGVVDAHVNVVLPDDNPLLDKTQQLPATSSVLLQYQGDQPPLKADEVKSLVAKGVQGLSPDEVSVVMKKVNGVPIPPITYGPLLASEWTVLIALAISIITGVTALSLVFISQKRKRTIKKLERQLRNQGESKQLESVGVEA